MHKTIQLYFFTSTILNWIPILRNDNNKEIITSSLKFLRNSNKIKVFAFVIMPNHIHIVWEIDELYKYSDIVRDFKKFTAQKIKEDLKKNYPELLQKFYIESKDRTFQLWKRNSLSIPIISKKVMVQKINYIHENPLKPKWKLAVEPQEYKYSSASFYYEDIDKFNFLERYPGI